MVSTEKLAKSIQQAGLPPVELWDPELCGDLDLKITADGSWLYQNTPFTHKKLKLLFSKVIKKENQDYFLVTPVEKVSIQVEWMPFTIIDYEVIQQQSHSIYRFTDNCENIIELTQSAQLKMSEYGSQLLPTINVRRNLFASFSRNCYYRLIADADIVAADGHNQVQIISNGIVFLLGKFAENE